MRRLLEFYKTEDKYKDAVNMHVIAFIDAVVNFPGVNGKSSTIITQFFSAGYCYYFANILKMAFGGRVCWVQDYSHIVWVDCKANATLDDIQASIAYDITGVFEEYTRLWPIEYLGDGIIPYKQNGEVFHRSKEFGAWCKSHQISEYQAISAIWQIIPEDVILTDYDQGLNFIETACYYYDANVNQIDTFIESVQSQGSIDPCIVHKGIQAYLDTIVHKKQAVSSPDKITGFDIN